MPINSVPVATALQTIAVIMFRSFEQFHRGYSACRPALQPSWAGKRAAARRRERLGLVAEGEKRQAAGVELTLEAGDEGEGFGGEDYIRVGSG